MNLTVYFLDGEFEPFKGIREIIEEGSYTVLIPEETSDEPLSRINTSQIKRIRIWRENEKD